MLRIRYYNQIVEPSTIKEYGGWRASFILFLAALVMKMERWIEWHVMHLVTKRQGLAAYHVKALEGVFRQETSLQRNVNEAISGLVGPGIIDDRDERYKYRKNSTDKTYREARADRTNDFLAAYMENKAKKYASHNVRFADPEGDVIEDSNDHSEEVAS